MPRPEHRDPVGVEPVELPPSVRERTTLARIDYADAFLVTGPDDRSPAQWAAAMLSDAAPPVRAGLVAGWTLLGLRLTRDHSRASILGWPVHAADDDAVVLATSSRLGITANLVFERAPGGVTFATLVELRGALAPRLWRITEPLHVPIVRGLLRATDPS